MIDTIHYIGIVQALVIGVVLFSVRSNGRLEFKYLAILLACFSLALLNEVYGDYSDSAFHVLYPFKFFFLLPNLVYLHVNSKIIGANSRKTVLFYLLPGIIEFISLLTLMILVKSGSLDPESNFLFYFEEVYTYLTIAYTIWIQIIILRKISLYNSHLFKFLSTVHYKYLNWLRWVCVIMITNELYYVILYLFSSDIEANDLFYSAYALIELVLIFYIGIGAMLQINLKIDIPIYATLSNQDASSEDTSTTPIDSKIDELFLSIESFMKERKPYLVPDLNLNTLSKMMGISERQLSVAINKSTDQNFYTYINSFRVEEVEFMLKNNHSEKFSIAGIGEAAGFKSKSSFYTNFKKTTGLSPVQFLKEQS
ncbi:MAG: AraC-like DNA-binding protein [Crocinitomicaceae bacterium]